MPDVGSENGMNPGLEAGEGLSLKRSLGLPLLTLYGLGVIIGAGIYVLVGEIAGQAGMATPLSFLVAAGIAALTGLSYAELAVRYPEAAGEVAYARQAFGSDVLARLVGLGVLFVVVVAAASIARGAVGYVQVYLETPEWLYTKQEFTDFEFTCEMRLTGDKQRNTGIYYHVNNL